jgi:hypothetical protein
MPTPPVSVPLKSQPFGLQIQWETIEYVIVNQTPKAK